MNPVTGKNELSWISETNEIDMGRKNYSPAQQSQGGRYLADPEINRYVNQVGQRVAEHVARDLPYEFVVLNNSVPNAWALPGGKIAINRGLLLELHSEAELAAVLSHEIVHSAAKHGANAIQRNSIIQGLVLATALGASQSGYAEYSDYIVGGAQLGAQLIGQKYGRDAELEADYYGLKYMSLAGYDPVAAVSLQQTFVRLSGKQQSSWVSGLFASHPPSIDRVNANKTTIEALNLPTGKTYANQYKTKMAYLRASKPAYDKLEKANTLSAKKNFKEAIKLVTQALDQVPEEPKFYGFLGNLYYQQKRYSDANQAFTNALALDENYFEYYLGRGLSRNKQGNSVKARIDLERSNQLLPTAIANHTLGQLSLQTGNRAAAKNYFQIAMTATGNLGNQATQAFIQLDITDNPAKYVVTRVGLNAAGILIAEITNTTANNLTDLKLEFSVIINQQISKKHIQVANLSAKQTLLVSSKWQFDLAEQSPQFGGRIVHAEPGGR
ncbi:MAG: M48 family metalloprotease [Pseudomonadales bacterium]|nr:M48 family metalloprotease [Pseudomonadales bacterium]